MSVPVAIERLAETLAGFDAGYLLTAGADGRVKAVSARPAYDGGVLRVAAPGRGSVANVAAHETVTLLWPPSGRGTGPTAGFSLLVDGTAVAEGDDVVVTPSSAVLHKPVAG